MFQFDEVRDKSTGKLFRTLRPFADLSRDKEKEGLTIAMLLAVIEEEPEHTHYCCYHTTRMVPTIVSFWRCDCFKLESGIVFYEAEASISGGKMIAKADSRENALLMLGALGVRPEMRWFPEETLLERLEAETEQ